jgi:hypothetical protein
MVLQVAVMAGVVGHGGAHPLAPSSSLFRCGSMYISRSNALKTSSWLHGTKFTVFLWCSRVSRVKSISPEFLPALVKEAS